MPTGHPGTRRGPKPGYCHAEASREKIQASQLINRLQDDAFGKIVLTDGQRASIKILLGKCLPDLANLQISGDEKRPVELRVSWQK